MNHQFERPPSRRRTAAKWRRSRVARRRMPSHSASATIEPSTRSKPRSANRRSTSIAREGWSTVGGAYVKAPRARSSIKTCMAPRSLRKKYSTPASTRPGTYRACLINGIMKAPMIWRAFDNVLNERTRVANQCCGVTRGHGIARARRRVRSALNNARTSRLGMSPILFKDQRKVLPNEL